jgi:hypothetical protein
MKRPPLGRAYAVCQLCPAITTWPWTWDGEQTSHVSVKTLMFLFVSLFLCYDIDLILHWLHIFLSPDKTNYTWMMLWNFLGGMCHCSCHWDAMGGDWGGRGPYIWYQDALSLSLIVYSKDASPLKDGRSWVVILCILDLYDEDFCRVP